MSVAQTRFVSEQVVNSTALFQPDHAVVLIEAWAWDDKEGVISTDYEIHQVLAIEVLTGPVYWKEFHRGAAAESFRTAQDFERNHWEFTGDHVQRGFLFVRGGILESTNDSFSSPTNSILDPVVCDWPGCQNEERLAPFIAEAKEHALAKFRVHNATR